MNPLLLSCTGAVLVGGRSSRMGSPKHDLIMPDGRTMLQHVIAALGAMTRDVVLIGGPATLGHQLHLQQIDDLRLGLGPLGGIEALLASGIEPDGQYLVCPCDLPRISSQVLRMLLQPSTAGATTLRLNNRTEPESLPIRISAAALPVVQTLLDSGQRAVWRLIQALPAEIIPISGDWADQFININTPDDVREVRER